MFTVVLWFPTGTAMAGTADNVTGWAWSGSIGWVAMNSESLSLGYVPSFGVSLRTNPANLNYADLSGYAWSENVGWICFGGTCSGMTPEGGAAYAQYRSSWNGKADQVYGWAQVVAWGDDGWISLNCDHDTGADDCPTSNYATVLDTASGQFTRGGAESYGWGASSAMNGVGWINFSGVSTSWVPARLGMVIRPEGIYEPSGTGLVGTHLTSFDISFRGFWAGGGQRVECDLLKADGSRETIGKELPGTLRNGLTSITKVMGPTESVAENKLWYITACRIGDVPGIAACTSDAVCAPAGFCDEAVGKCRTVIASSSRRLPIYTHGNAWTGLESGQDQYNAVKCFAGFPDSHFKNAAQCDFAGDATYAMMMRRGMPMASVEAQCTDCNDRFCRGISYRCQTLARTSCVWGRADDGIADCTAADYAAGDLCCDRQPVSAGSAYSHIVDGMECTVGDPKDGYFDCDCGAAKFGTGDCYAPGAQAGDLCCTTDGTASWVTKL